MATIVITIGGTDVTDLISFRDATFTSLADGRPGQCRLRIKDPALVPNLSPTFPDIGDEIICTINGTRAWGGWVMSRNYEYAFPVEDTVNDYRSKTRWVSIVGSDWNLLFSRRYVFDEANPTTEIPEYAANTQDNTVIADIVANYLDLSGTGVDAASGVTNVGSPGQYEQFRIAAIGDSWGSVMSRICLNLGSIFYIDPDKVLRYVDDETATAPAGLSDKPGVGQIGYRLMTIEQSAEVLCNDMFVRGTGVGSPEMAVARVQDSASISRHGRFQYAELHSDMYKQETVNKRANTYISGSPQNKRGHKNPIDRVRCTIVNEHGFRVGQVVEFESQVHGWDDNIPIRELTFTFPTPTDVVYELALNHEIDPGLQFADWPGPPGKKHLPWGEDLMCSGGGGGGGGGGTPQTLYGFLIPPHRHEYPEYLWGITGRYTYNEYDQSYWWPARWYDWTNEYLDPETYGEPVTTIWECPWWITHGAQPAVDIAFPMTLGAAVDSDGDDTPDMLDAFTDCTYDTFSRSVNRTGGELVDNPWMGVDEAQWVNDDSGAWGTMDSGGSWAQSPNEVADVMQGIYDGAAVLRAQVGSTPEAWAFSANLEGAATGESAEYLIQWRFRGDLWVEYTSGDPAPTPTFWAMGHPVKEVPVSNLTVVSGSIGGVATDIRTGDPTNAWYYSRIQISNDGVDTRWKSRTWLATSAEPGTWDYDLDYYTDLEGPSLFVSFASSGWQTTTVGGSGTPVPVTPLPDDPHYGQFEIGSVAIVNGDCGAGGACTYTTSYPFISGTLKASFGNEPLTVTETGGQTFTVDPDFGSTIEVTYVRSDAYEGDDEGVYTDPGGPGSYSGGGSGEWQWPCEGYITQEYGCTGFSWEPPRGSCAHFHDGIDIANVSGTPLYAPAAGVINFIGWNPYDIGNDPAYIVVIDVPGGYQIGMAHLLPIKKVYAGQGVSKGQLVGYMGNTGKSTGSHVHFEARYNGADFNPRVKLQGEP